MSLSPPDKQNAMSTILFESIDRLYRTHIPTLYQQAHAFPEDISAIWSQIVEQGWHELFATPEATQALSPRDLAQLARLDGYHAAPWPLAWKALYSFLFQNSPIRPSENVAWFKPQARLDSLPTSLTGTIQWPAIRADQPGQLLVPVQPAGQQHLDIYVLNLPAEVLKQSSLQNQASEPMARLVNYPIETASKLVSVDYHWFIAMSLLVKNFALYGALERAHEMTNQYLSQREQFGQPLSRFQVLQHQVAINTGELATAQSSLEAFASQLHWNKPQEENLLLLADLVNSNMAQVIASSIRSFHQMHGAIGFTMEYPLQRYTRRLAAWLPLIRGEFQSAQAIGAEVLASHGAWDKFSSLAEPVSRSVDSRSV